jgi:lipopolysaccharide assembly outer membrane protein LptD (OstA)
LDQEHVGFHLLRITTYTPENAIDLTIEMTDSILDLKTRILSSGQRTTIRRADFNIAGDSVQFDTNARVGKLMGNVKMVITDQSHFNPPQPDQ